MNLISIDIYRDKIQFEVFSIYNNKRNSVLQNEIKIPISFSIGDKLEYLRKFIITIINHNKVKKAYLNINDNLDIDINYDAFKTGSNISLIAKMDSDIARKYEQIRQLTELNIEIHKDIEEALLND